MEGFPGNEELVGREIREKKEGKPPVIGVITEAKLESDGSLRLTWIPDSTEPTRMILLAHEEWTAKHVVGVSTNTIYLNPKSGLRVRSTGVPNGTAIYVISTSFIQDTPREC